MPLKVLTFNFCFQLDILEGRDTIVDFDDIYGRPGNDGEDDLHLFFVKFKFVFLNNALLNFFNTFHLIGNDVWPPLVQKRLV